MVAIWKEKITIQTHEVDMFNNLKLSSLFNYCQAAACHHANALAIGEQYLYDQHLAWVIARMNLEMVHYPHKGEVLTVETWLEDAPRMYGIRHFIFYDNNDNIVCRISSAWLLLDLVKRQIKRMRSLCLKLPVIEDSWRLEIKAPEKIDKIDVDICNETAQREIIPRYHDIDINQHVNNARYVDWICDCFDAEYLDRKQIQYLKIDYLHEIKLQQAIELKTYQSLDANTSYFVAKTKDHDQKAFIAKVEWYKASPEVS